MGQLGAETGQPLSMSMPGQMKFCQAKNITLTLFRPPQHLRECSRCLPSYENENMNATTSANTTAPRTTSTADAPSEIIQRRPHSIATTPTAIDTQERYSFAQSEPPTNDSYHINVGYILVLVLIVQVNELVNE